MAGTDTDGRGATPPPKGWRRFWGGHHSVYVNSRHVRVHYARIADDLIPAIGPLRPKRVLDWGCGDALFAPRVAAHCGELMLYDAVESVQMRLRDRFAGAPNITVLDTTAWAALPDGSIDTILLNSVAQYLSPTEMAQVLTAFSHTIRPGGEAIFADIIAPHRSPLADVWALLGPAALNGYLFAALGGLARMFFSEYRTLRSTAGFACYGEDEFLALLRRHGFSAERMPRNIGFSRHRMAFRARLATATTRPARPDR